MGRERPVGQAGVVGGLGIVWPLWLRADFTGCDISDDTEGDNEAKHELAHTTRQQAQRSTSLKQLVTMGPTLMYSS